ncbi:MAG TPA: magnesium transporter [Tepidisphaeraceae bacterium]|jgi:magnesium transporter|nr:magnesium transporter [Tepidisphaeraceae bacterium]
MSTTPISSRTLDNEQLSIYSTRVNHAGPREARDLLEPLPDADIVEILSRVSPSVAENVLWRFPESRRRSITAAAPTLLSKQWETNRAYPGGSIGRMMDPPVGILPPDISAAEAVTRLREMVKHALITYGFICNPDGFLVGILVMRDLLLADPNERLDHIMLKNPFSLDPKMKALDAMRAVLDRHYPVYPVCDVSGVFIGLVRGQTLFQQEAIEISAQAGAMVGVEKEERISTPWQRSLRYRHPWLQLNLLTAFLAAGIVSMFSTTIARIGVLAAFLPVMNGQTANTGCQSLAVTLRGMILGELKPGQHWPVVIKEACLGTANGLLVGMMAGLGMICFAHFQHAEHPYKLALVVCIAMSGSCLAAGISGACVPLLLRKLGFDPVTASSIFLTTATDIASTYALLGLATLIVH